MSKFKLSKFNSRDNPLMAVALKFTVRRLAIAVGVSVTDLDEPRQMVNVTPQLVG